MMKVRFLFSSLALLAGACVLGLSLFSATQVASTGSQAASEGKLYFSQEILPDHSLYKVLMVMDRIQLEAAPENEQVYIRLEYATRRLEYSKALLDKDNESLALTTLLKSQQYLHEAVRAAIMQGAPDSTKQRVQKTLEYHHRELKALSPRFSDSSRSQVDRVIEEQLLVHAELAASLSKN